MGGGREARGGRQGGKGRRMEERRRKGRRGGVEEKGKGWSLRRNTYYTHLTVTLRTPFFLKFRINDRVLFRPWCIGAGNTCVCI